MSYASQLTSVDADLDMRLGVCSNEGERFAWLVLTSFRSAISVLIEARSKGSCKQFIANCCYLERTQKRLLDRKAGNAIYKIWPKRSVPLGRYHLSGTRNQHFHSQTNFQRDSTRKRCGKTKGISQPVYGRV